MFFINNIEGNRLSRKLIFLAIYIQICIKAKQRGMGNEKASQSRNPEFDQFGHGVPSCRGSRVDGRCTSGLGEAVGDTGTDRSNPEFGKRGKIACFRN